MLAERVPGLMFSRTGRYPAVDQIAPSELDRVMKPFIPILQQAGVKLEDDEIVLPRVLWGDCNPPEPDNWVNVNLIENPEQWPLYKMFRQPSGLAVNAENRIGKPRSSYEQDLKTMKKSDARRYVYGEIGYGSDGAAIYADDFNTMIHRADEFLMPVRELPIGLGVDAGGSPAAVITQDMPNGQLRVLREICADPGTGPARFSEMLFNVLITDFPGLAISEAYGDPSAWYGADKVKGELAWMEIVSKALGIIIMPTETNEISLRHDAVRWYLSKRIDGNTPGLLIDPRCKKLIGGFASHYKLTKNASAGKTDSIEVVKNEWSHPHDALQYKCLGHQGRMGVVRKASQIGRPGNVVPIRGNTVPTKTFDVFAV